MADFKIQKKNGLTGKWELWGFVKDVETIGGAKAHFGTYVSGKGGKFRLLDPNDNVIDLRG